MEGAEAKVKRIKRFGLTLLKKIRIKKKYRVAELDQQIRKQRTKREVKILHKAKLAGVKAPVVYEVSDFYFVMSYEGNKKIILDKKGIRTAIKSLAKLHSADIIHNDYTSANILANGTIIDFGLSFISSRIEDKAIDLLTFLRTIKDRSYAENLYLKHYKDGKKVLDRIKQIEKRMRYS